jgi:tetratricopeptide (TPR) repeat protein
MGPTPAHPRTVAPAAKGAATISGDADFTRDAYATHDSIQLRDGTISIDARDRFPVAVAIGDTTINVANAHVEIRAAHGVIVSAHAFAGSVERTSPESKAIISAGEVWTPAPPAAALAAFRAGWSALHEGRNADALAAFERASDPVIAEEAAFWAAVAAQRADDREGAAQRFRAFLDAYPQSTRADAARAALHQLP